MIMISIIETASFWWIFLPQQVEFLGVQISSCPTSLPSVHQQNLLQSLGKSLQRNKQRTEMFILKKCPHSDISGLMGLTIPALPCEVSLWNLLPWHWDRRALPEPCRAIPPHQALAAQGQTKADFPNHWLVSWWMLNWSGADHCGHLEIEACF